MRGNIKWYHKTKHFGYLIAEPDNQEVFFHINDCSGFDPKEGVPVEFDLGLDRRRRVKAIKIKCVSVGVGDEHSAKSGSL